MSVGTFFGYCVVVVLGACLASEANSAEIRLAATPRGERPLPGITIEGQIEAGDYARFLALVLATKGANNVYLASPGGDFLESLRIGRLIRALNMTTTIYFPGIRLNDPSNRVCASACFFLFVAGVRRSYVEDALDPASFDNLLGVHRPYLAREHYQAIGLGEAAKAHRWLRDTVSSYLKEMSVPNPDRYVSMIMSTDSGDIEWLPKEEVDRDLDGFVDQYDEWFRANCPRTTESQYEVFLRIGRRSDRGFQLTNEERAFSAEFLRLGETQAFCERDKLIEIQEQSRERILRETLSER